MTRFRNEGFATSLIGMYVSYSESDGLRYEGPIVAAWIADDDIKVVVQRTDGKFGYTYIGNCKVGALPKPAPTSPANPALEGRQQTKPETR